MEPQRRIWLIAFLVAHSFVVLLLRDATPGLHAAVAGAGMVAAVLIWAWHDLWTEKPGAMLPFALSPVPDLETAPRLLPRLAAMPPLDPHTLAPVAEAGGNKSFQHRE